MSYNNPMGYITGILLSPFSALPLINSIVFQQCGIDIPEILDRNC